VAGKRLAGVYTVDAGIWEGVSPFEKLQVRNLLMEELRDLVDSMVADDTNRKKHLWKLVLNPDFENSEAEVARQLGISRQRVNVVVDTLRQKLTEIEAKLDGVVDI
jgi:hypothetical protein